MEVIVENSFEQALKSFENKIKRSGLMRDLKLRQAYESPSKKRRRKRTKNIKRAKRTEIATVKLRAYRAGERRVTQQEYVRRKKAELAGEVRREEEKA